MVGKANYTCAKCGTTSQEDTSVTFHRFPLPSVHGSLKAKVWAKYCFPNEDWTEDRSLHRLFKSHKMMCSNHFDDSSFTSNERKRLNKFAIPTDACGILAQLRDQQHHRDEMASEPSTSASSCSTSNAHLKEYNPQTMQMASEPSTSASSCSTSNAHLKEYNSQTMQESYKSKGLLKEIEAKALTELTPKKQKLYKRCRQNLVEILRLRRKFKKVNKSKRDIIQSLESDSAVNSLMNSKLGSPFYLLMQSQLKNNTRKLAGRRWTIHDKVLALSIYKKSSSCYRLLRRLFCLPSVSSLKKVLNKIPLKCGINPQIIETIKEITKKRSIEDNMCILAFDEMSIRKNVSYNVKSDMFDGYQDHASQGRTPEIATHALTFMAIGVRKNWKQPIAFYFSGSCVTADRLSVLLKEVLSACFIAGLEVIGTVCDLDGVNLRAISTLGSSKERPYFDYEGHEIVTVLDPPHLLKCFRNNFLKHDIQYPQDVQIDGRQSIGVAKWSHIQEFYHCEKMNQNFVFAPALTEQHLQPNGKQKMKVRLAAQVLSHSVAAGLFAKIGQGEMSQEAIATATIVSNMDKLFDCMNGDTPHRKRGKLQLTNMTSTSPHLTFFKNMKDFFSNMKFLGARCKPPSQDGWLRTLNAIERIYKNFKNYNLKSLSPRRLNQDPLENCFGCIRSNCGSNPNPTSVQFIAALKTGMITNLINNNKNRNCADDNNDLLGNFKVFIEKGCEEQDNATSSAPILERVHGAEEEEVQNIEIPQCSGEMQACAYVCGFIIKHLDLNCELCKKIMLADQNTEVFHLFTSFKEYNDRTPSLKYVKPSFCSAVENAATLINNYLKENSHKENVKLSIKQICENKTNFDWLRGCIEHYENNKNKIIESTIAVCLKRFCIKINREFTEEASKKLLVRKINILKHV